MFMNCTSLPYSFYSILKDRDSIVFDLYSHRPDKIISTVYLDEDILSELMCNEANNTSAISLVAGDSYQLPSQLFMGYFRLV